MRATPPDWISFHLHLPGRFDEFLREALPPLLTAERERGALRRFFFIRYSEGGHHLRLRFLAAAPEGRAALGRRLAGGLALAMAGFDPAADGPLRLEAGRYDRSLHYFGESRESVYAELLNEVTSGLALALLPSFAGQTRGKCRLVLAGLLDLLTARSIPSPPDRLPALADSLAFAARTAAELGLAEGGEADGGEAVARRWAAALPEIRPRLEAALRGEADFGRLAALLRRTRRCSPRGPFVAVHALHLLCNKLGFSLLEEREAFATLAAAAENLSQRRNR